MSTSPIRADLIIRNARLIDGTGAPPVDGDLAVTGVRIVGLGALPGATAASEIDARRKVVAPGFIDPHTHDDNLLLSDPTMAPKVSQGVTTVIAGNCGISLAPLTLAGAPTPPLDLLGDQRNFGFPRFADYLGRLDAEPPAINAAFLVGHMTLRVGCMDRFDRPATPDEIATMQRRLDDSLAAGAIGFSTGLYYKPSAAAPTEEVIDLAKIARQRGGLYVTHMRNEDDRVMTALDESFAIGREAELPVVISHHKVIGRRNFGRSAETLPFIAERARRQPIGFDVYPYIASSTVLSVDRFKASERIIVTWSKARPEVSGRDLADIAREMNCSIEDAAAALQPAGAIYFMMDERDVQRVLSSEHAMVGSDGLPHDVFPHPRLWGTFPRVLGHYSRDLALFPLHEAVHKMTGLTAANFGLRDRGVLRVGAFADLVLFDPETVIDRATFEKPTQPAAGIELVMVNGRPVWRDGAPTGARPGRALRRAELERPMGGWRPGAGAAPAF
ncbi:MAG TPA: D-aminoacylase [Candidatus Sulfotelmatobacter sp.]|nr:D-aminoacylase [Candidatus Sulfotelmatobacter sp.]